LSAQQGNLMASLIERARLPWNQAFDGRPVAVPPDGPLPRINLAGGVVLTLLSPKSEDIGKLWELWKRGAANPKSMQSLPDEPSEEEGGDDAPASEQGVAADLRKEPDEVSANQPESPVEVAPSIDVEALAQAPFRADRSLPNGASIAFLAEVDGRSLLIGGDAHSRVLVESIKRLLIERRNEGHSRLGVSLFVVPHGGSQNTVSRELVELIACERYVFSANGRFGRPHQEAVARILVFGGNNSGTPSRLIFNYRSPENSIWDDKELQARYRYEAIYPEEGSAGIKIRL
jgi:hypothetical protein